MKNIDIINKIISKQLSIDIKIVESVNNFYWKEGVVKKISKLESGAIFVKGLLTFTTSRYNVKRDISQTIRKIRYSTISNKYTDIKKEEIVSELYKRLKILLIERNNLAKIIYEQDNRVYESNT